MNQTPLIFAINLAHQAGQVLRTYYQSKNTYAHLKADRSVVTEADLVVDRSISDAIRAAYPEDDLLSEELQPKLQTSNTGAVWIVDPLDGTTNFSLGLPFWGVLITRLIGGEPDLTVMYFPMLDELFTAVRGAGATFNNMPIQIQAPDPEITTAFFACCARTYRQYEVRVRYKPRILGSAGYTFCNVGRGVALVGFEATPKIWDIAGAWLLVQEAGGVIAPHHGPQPFPLITGVDFARQSYPTLAAPDHKLLETIQNQIIPKGR